MLKLTYDLVVFFCAWCKGIEYTRHKCQDCGKLLLIYHMKDLDGGEDMPQHDC